MRKFHLWGMFLVMAAFVFLLSGCGGGSLDPQSSDEGTDTDTGGTPSAYTDNYDIPGTLAGRWFLTEGSGSAISVLSGDNDTLALTMAANTQMNFSDVNISGDTGSASVYYSIKLRAFDDANIYRGDFEINSYRDNEDTVKFQPVSLTHYGEDIWRAENADGDIMLLSFTSANSFNLAWNGFKYLNIGNTRTIQYHCTLECSFTKQ